MKAVSLEREARRLLRIAVAEPRLAQDAWTEWAEAVGRREATLAPHLRELLPTAAARAAALGLTGPDRLMRELRVARLVEERRDLAFRAAAEQVVALASAGGWRPIMVDGFGLAMRHYPAPSWRHSARIDLVFEARAPVADIATLLVRSEPGWRRTAATARVTELRHPTEMRVTLRSGALHQGRRVFRHDGLLASAETVWLGPHGVFVPGDADALALIDGADGAGRRAAGWLWLLDAAMLVKAGLQPAPAISAGLHQALTAIDPALSAGLSLRPPPAVAGLPGMLRRARTWFMPP